MGKKQKNDGKKIKRYSKFSMAHRINFCQYIEENKISVKHAAEKFRINYSTAKVLFRSYKKQLSREELKINSTNLEDTNKIKAKVEEKNQTQYR